MGTSLDSDSSSEYSDSELNIDEKKENIDVPSDDEIAPSGIKEETINASENLDCDRDDDLNVKIKAEGPKFGSSENPVFPTLGTNMTSDSSSENSDSEEDE